MTPNEKERRISAIERKVNKIKAKQLKEIKRKDKKLQKKIAYVLSLLEKNPLHTTYE